MTIANCPKCHEEVTVPREGSTDSRVRCPLCQEEYVLGEVLKALPPALILLDPVGVIADVAEATEDEIPGVVSEPAAAAFMLDDAVMTTTSRERPTVRVAPRPRRRERNPVIEIIKVIGGGVAGLCIAQLILWWWPTQLDLRRRDPFEFAPKVAKYAPFILPAQLRSTDLSDDENRVSRSDGPSSRNSHDQKDSLNGGLGDSAIGESATDGDFLFRGNSSKKMDLKSLEEFTLPADTEDTSAKKASSEPDGFDIPAPDFPLTPKVPSKRSEIDRQSPDREPETTTKKRAAEPVRPDEPLPRVTRVESATSEDLAEAVSQFAAAHKAWLQSDNEDEIEQRGSAFYEMAARLAEVTAIVAPEAADTAPQVAQTTRLLSEAGKDARIRKLISEKLPNWITRSDRPSRGLVAVGTVQRDNGEPTIVCGTLKFATTIYDDELESLADGQRVLLVGAALRPVANPAGAIQVRRGLLLQLGDDAKKEVPKDADSPPSDSSKSENSESGDKSP